MCGVYSVQTHLSDVGGEVGEEVAEGAVVGPGTQLAEEGAQHGQQTSPVTSQHRAEPRDQDQQHCEHLDEIWNYLNRLRTELINLLNLSPKMDKIGGWFPPKIDIGSIGTSVSVKQPTTKHNYFKQTEIFVW